GSQSLNTRKASFGWQESSTVSLATKTKLPSGTVVSNANCGIPFQVGHMPSNRDQSFIRPAGLARSASQLTPGGVETHAHRMANELAQKRWLLLIHQLPAKPGYVRVKTWRRLQALGAVAVKNAVHALPASEQSQEDFEWLLKEIHEAGGEAMICEARLIDGLSDSDVQTLFNAARDDEYADIAENARTLSATLKDASSTDARADLKAQYARLKKRLAEVIAIDFFDANGRQSADGLVRGLELALSEP